MKSLLVIVFAALGIAGIGCTALVGGVSVNDAGTSVDSGATSDAGGEEVDSGTADAGQLDAGVPVLEWDPGNLWLVAGLPAVIELSQTLPVGIARGGTFSIDPSVAPLPMGVTLTPSGQLSGAGATARSMTEVVFSYAEP